MKGLVGWIIRLGAELLNAMSIHTQDRGLRKPYPDSSTESFEQANDLLDKARFGMQVRTPSPCLHVRRIDDEVFGLHRTIILDLFYNATCCRPGLGVSEGRRVGGTLGWHRIVLIA